MIHIFLPDTKIYYHIVHTDREEHHMFSYSSHVYMYIYTPTHVLGLSICSIWELFLLFFKKIIGLRAALSSKATLSLLTTDRI